MTGKPKRPTASECELKSLDRSAPDYRVIQGLSLAELHARIHDHLAKGWLPQGGIAIDQGEFYQAVYKPGSRP